LANTSSHKQKWACRSTKVNDYLHSYISRNVANSKDYRINTKNNSRCLDKRYF